MLVGSHTARRPDWPAVHVHTSAGAARVEHNRELSAIASWRRTLAAPTAVVVPPVEKARQQHNPHQQHEQAADEIFALPWTHQTRRRCRRTCTTSRPTGTVVSQRSGSVRGFNVLQHSKPRSVLLHRNAPAAARTYDHHSHRSPAVLHRRPSKPAPSQVVPRACRSGASPSRTTARPRGGAGMHAPIEGSSTARLAGGPSPPEGTDS